MNPSGSHASARTFTGSPAVCGQGTPALPDTELDEAYAALRRAWTSEPVVPIERRREALESLKRVLKEFTPRMIAAANADFGCRSAFTTKLGDVATMQSELGYVLEHLPRWTAPEARHTELHFRFGSGQVQRQALGVVGVMAPWNYPFRLALGPVVAAIASGNRVLLKPSERAPRCAELLQTIVAAAFATDHVRTVVGDVTVGARLCALPLDHLFFTGSTEVGRAVLRAASAHLTPVTLELGGKCPVILERSYPVARAAGRILAGKLFNAGQTCMAPDHLWVHRSRLDEVLRELRAACRRSYPRLGDNDDYTSIIDDRHYERLAALVDDAAQRGASVEAQNPANELLPTSARKLAPTLVWNVSDSMRLCQEEVFGPILPIHVYDSLDDVLADMRRKPAPLALYYFDNDPKRSRDVVSRTRSGTVCVNEVMLQSIQNDLPFGGVGASGMGKYHGPEGFQCFTHARSVFHQGRVNGTSLLLPPYGRLARALVEWLQR